MTKKYYKVLKDNFLWEKDAILKLNESGDGYVSMNDLWDVVEDCSEYISSKIIEKNPKWFGRVYKIDLLTKTVYCTKQVAKSLLKKEYKSKKE